MLNELITQLRINPTIHPSALAMALNTTTGMVQSMLMTLVSIGMLEEVDTCSEDHCSGCPLTSSCSPEHGKTRLWKLKSA